ncbi:MAG: DUF4783 domain-containing protein [Chitinophagaceae bacterium]|nr:DUF4783 domain-containing protein [Chitinophagaceae bacterium]
MKAKFYTGFVLLIAFAITAFSFVQKDEIIDALKSGSAEKISPYFDQMVDITLPGKSNSYSKQQAELVLKDFFNINKVRNFELQHSGSNPSSNFLIGKLSTSNGTFRTTVYMRQRGDKQMVQGIEFEPSK